ncbi:MAG: hypothetical protein KDA21_12725, partial [Phycisphaerales bacterium]|nr:hypothetical protein [Phycisphaerales bacterium]
TLVRRGVPIRIFKDMSKVDEPRLNGLIEDSFGRTLLPGYLERAAPEMVLVAGDYAACAVVRPGPTAPYLDKFAVSAQGQGAGLGASLWNRLATECPRLLWRSRTDNPIRNWYFGLADGMHRAPNWIVFWTGLEERDEIAQGIEFALAEPPSFESPVVTRGEVSIVS